MPSSTVSSLVPVSFAAGVRSRMPSQTAMTATAHGDTISSPRSVDVVVTPPPPPEPLLLEGDEFYVSHDGVSRTFYRLEDFPQGCSVKSPVALEEFYDLKGAKKTFVIREPQQSTAADGQNDQKDVVLAPNVQGVACLGQPKSAFEIQEIDQGVFGSAGTGATTWESSIAMSLFFSANPELLRGDVVEVGSGVGLGGILSQIALQGDIFMRSMTLTDGNVEVLKQCQENVNHASSSYPRQRRVPTHVEQVDWYGYLNADPSTKLTSTYDTVLASDCAYLYPDILALSRTLASLCKRNADAKIHVFAPYNRGALHELILQLQNENMKVVLDWIEMSRYRLKPLRRGMTHATFPDATHIHHFCRKEDECDYASRNVAKFLHITASHETRMTHTDVSHSEFLDID